MVDRDEFSAFVRANSRALQRSAWLLTGDWSAAEDLVQSALVRTWARWQRLAAPEAALAYTRRVMFTVLLGWRGRRWIGEMALGWLPEVVERHDETELVDTRSDLLRAVGTLPPHQRAVVVLRYFDDLSEKDTAAALGCSVGTVKSQAARALASLRAMSTLRVSESEELL
ncbi:MAG TPA: SigE family RNA polymerase sigma factor [Jatrophihabitans sp.]|nr:SigE family RNA polymerase sigma factor [Jatrophihabitans sp.]